MEHFGGRRWRPPFAPRRALRPNGRVKRSAVLNVAVAFMVVAAVFCLPRIPQDPAYHAFADGRTVLGVRNFWNVVSNAPFVVVGAMGIAVVWRRGAGRDLAPYAWLFLGVFLTGFASAAYHLAPDNRTLVWDRLPMTLIFVSLYAGVIADRVSVKWAVRLLPVLVVIGLASVIYWGATDDLRPYGVVQFYPFVGIAMLLGLYQSRYTRGGDILWIGATYAVAKAFEVGDRWTFQATAGLVSGHTVKHLVAAGATYLIMKSVRDRRPITDGAVG